LADETLRHLESDDRAEAVPPEVVRALRLHAPQLVEVMRRHILDGSDRRRPAVQATHLEPVERLLLPEQPRERLEVEHGTRTPVDTEKRRIGAVRLDRYERGPSPGIRVALEERSQPFDAWRLKQGAER